MDGSQGTATTTLHGPHTTVAQAATVTTELLQAAQESARRADAREKRIRRMRAESESAAHLTRTSHDALDALELEFGPSSSTSQP